jgi:hypothetical protein
LKLLGYDWRSLGARRVEITYYWQAMRSMEDEYASYVRLRSGNQEFADDSVLGKTRTTAGWVPGEIVKDRRVLTLAADGTYDARIGVWVPRSRRNVRVGRWWGPRTAPFCRIVAAADSVTVERVR